MLLNSKPSMVHSTDEELALHMKLFNPEKYLEICTLNKTIHTSNAGLYTGLARLLHEVFSTHSPGERLLDVGSGPTLWHVMSASAKYKNITLSDPMPENRAIQRNYMSDVSHYDNWAEHFKLTARLEGNEEKWRNIGARLRSCIRDVVYCNVHDQQPLGKERQDDPYDCILSCLCLNGACADVPSFIRAVGNIASLAKPGAPIVLAGVLDSSFYKCGDNPIKQLPVTAEAVQQMVEDAGCTVTKFVSAHVDSHISNVKGIYVVEARKLV